VTSDQLAKVGIVTLQRFLEAVLLPVRVAAELAETQAPAHAADWRYRSFAALLLAEGTVFGASGHVPIAQRGPPGECMANARAWSAADGHAYAEGWAATNRYVIGVEHAWCLSAEGRVLDPTWAPGTGLVYVGLAVTAAYRLGVAHPILLRPHEAGLALLRHGLPDEARVTVGQPCPELARSWPSARSAPCRRGA